MKAAIIQTGLSVSKLKEVRFITFMLFILVKLLKYMYFYVASGSLLIYNSVVVLSRVLLSFP